MFGSRLSETANWWFMHGFGGQPAKFRSKLSLTCAMLSHSVMSDSLWPHGLHPARLLCPWDSPGKILECVAMPSSRGSSQPRDQSPGSSLVSPALAGRFFTTNTTWEAPYLPRWSLNIQKFKNACLYETAKIQGILKGLSYIYVGLEHRRMAIVVMEN